MLRTALRGAGWGAVVGLPAGFVAPWFALAALHLDPLALLLTLFYGWVTAPVGALYGAASGAITCAIASPLRADPVRLRRLRGVWAFVAAAVTAALTTAIFRPSLQPGPNETMGHVREDIAMFYVGPAVAAATAAAALVPGLVASTVSAPRRDEGTG